MSSSDLSAPVIVPVADAPVHRAFGDEATFHLTGEQTGGRYVMLTSLVADPGVGPPPHWHENADEWFLVLEGRAEFLVDGEWREALPGTTVFVPRGVVHTFRNAGDTPLKQLIQVSPAGFDTFFAKCAEEFAREGGPDMPKVLEISREHGIHYA